MNPILLFAALCLAFSPALRADDDHDHKEHAEHDHDHDENGKDAKKGPNGGRIVSSVTPAFEVFVTKERKLKITFLDEDNKPVAPGKQVLTATSGERANPTRLVFVKGEGDDGNSLLSDKVLPDGAHVPLILQIKVTPDAKTVIERMTLHLHD